ncbi:hypothetical protein Barb4_00756 [Bacteroidales bacterium Barb4]|nr:hypothetical protein Barb4_00756 [Bacteroidales bacterium Barb4]
MLSQSLQLEKLCRCPEGARDFSPTCSAAECGIYGMGDPVASCKDARFQPHMERMRNVGSAECGVIRTMPTGEF